MTKEGTIAWWSPEIRVKVVYVPSLEEAPNTDASYD